MGRRRRGLLTAGDVPFLHLRRRALHGARVHLSVSVLGFQRWARRTHTQEEETSSARGGGRDQGAERHGSRTSVSHVCRAVRTGRERKP